MIADHIIAIQVGEALLEDLSFAVDYSANLVDSDTLSHAVIKTKQDLVLCGIKWVNQTFMQIDPNTALSWHYQEGDKVKSGSVLVDIHGSARSILTAERSALNFLQTLSATATTVGAFVDKVASTSTKIMDTRKTIPGLRLAQKYAVTVGGGYNQRMGLYDGVLIKENHISACGGVTAALQVAFNQTPNHISIQIEVETYDQLVEAIVNKAKLVLLDNMSVDQIEKCVEYAKGKAVELEASGNINLDNVLEYAKTGVQRISLGCLTKNISAIDLSLIILG